MNQGRPLCTRDTNHNQERKTDCQGITGGLIVKHECRILSHIKTANYMTCTFVDQIPNQSSILISTRLSYIRLLRRNHLLTPNDENLSKASNQ